MFLKPKEKKIGLALSGGSTWGMAHIGVLQALEELDIKVSYISGTSVGSFIGALYASGISSTQLERIASSANWGKFSRPHISFTGLFSLEPMERFIRKYLKNPYIENMPLPFCAVATDILSGKEVLFESGYLPTIIRGSCSIPGIFEPVVMDDMLIVDGGIVNNLPVSANRALGADFVIGVNLSPEISNFIPHNTVELLIKTFLVMQNANTLKEAAMADVLIDINPEKNKPCRF